MKKLLIAITALFMCVGVANAGHIDPVTGTKGLHTGTHVQSFGLGFAAGIVMAAVGQSNAQGVLPCHSRKDVKVKMKGNNSYYMATDCEVNGFN